MDNIMFEMRREAAAGARTGLFLVAYFSGLLTVLAATATSVGIVAAAVSSLL